MNTHAHGDALFIQQTAKSMRWLDRRNASRGDRRRSSILIANTTFLEPERAEPRAADGRRGRQLRRRRRGAGLRLAALLQKPGQFRRLSKQVYISPSPPLIKRILLLWLRLAAELATLSAPSDGWQSHADSHPHRPGDEPRPAANGCGARWATSGSIPTARWANLSAL